MNSFNRLGNYEIIKQLGHGGMGGALLAKDVVLNRQVALKRVQHTGDPNDEAIITATRRGIELQNHLGQMVPDHIPRVYEYGDKDGWFYAVMELIDGEDISTRLARGGIPFEDAARIAKELLTAIEIAHSFDGSVKGRPVRGILHGDIKPANIRVTPQGRVYLLDFGIAKELSATRPLTDGEFGTVHYLSPEILDSGKLTLADDLWALGIVLFQMVTGRVPFDAPTRREIENLILSRPPVPALPSDCPALLQQIIHRALAPHPPGRYASASQFKSDLQQFLARVQEEVTRPTVFPNTPPAPQADLASPTPPPAQPRKYWKLVAAILGAALLFFGIRDGLAYRDASTLSGELHQRQLVSPAEIESYWQRYEQVASRSLFKLGLNNACWPLKNSLVAMADQTINKYRNEDSPNVVASDWQAAHLCLERAVQLDPSDKTAKAKQFYAAGHWLRIEARDTKSKESLTRAIRSFESAASLWSDWADPHFGLARTCVYEASSIEPIQLEKCLAELETAEKLGFATYKRNTAIRGDGWQKHGLQLQKKASSVRNHSEEGGLLIQARKAHLQAQDYYRRNPMFAESAKNSSESGKQIERIERRLLELGVNPW